MIYPWQTTQWSCACDLIQQQYAGGLLLRGAAGVGTIHFAQQLSALALCEQATQSACEQCASCHLRQSSQHPDYITLSSNDSMIKIDSIRDMSTRCQQSATRGGYQVVLIEAADKLTLASANALLKILEEPPGRVLFILCCEHLTRLPVTVVSRCQVLSFPPVPTKIAMPWLETTYPGVDRISDVWSLANGQPLIVEEMLAQDSLSISTRLLNDLVSLKSSSWQFTSMGSRWKDIGCEQLLSHLLYLSENMIREQHGNVFSDDLSMQQLKTTDALSHLPLPQLFQWRDRLLELRSYQRLGSISEPLLYDAVAYACDDLMHCRLTGELLC